MPPETTAAAPSTTIKHATLAAALVAAQGEVTDPRKSAENPHFRSRYADLAEVLHVVRPVFGRHGLAIWSGITVTEGGVTVVAVDLIHEGGEHRRSAVPISAAILGDPQKCGSFVSYMRRYLTQGIANVTGDDDDGNAASAPKASTPRIDETGALIERIRACNDIDDLRAMRAAVSAAGATASAAWKARGEFLKAAAEAP